MNTPISTSPSQVSHGVRVSVQSMFMPDQSSAKSGTYCYAYRISIENQTNEPVQLLRRSWRILDGHGEEKRVEGLGVVGQQPVLAPGASHSYVSGAVLPTPIGRMHGHYMFVRLPSGTEFPVQIPAFLLVAPYLLN